ncbi:BA75_03890T0 [Komagataella pastoris]|uniref:BA75_03890T0 n=1 Tax=Komagataella pastoris TaxID=4922 RepID=A0A1B2JFZ7_PICPA|nr:BA75_03890T0 [Komagataella pastoris]
MSKIMGLTTLSLGNNLHHDPDKKSFKERISSKLHLHNDNHPKVPPLYVETSTHQNEEPTLVSGSAASSITPSVGAESMNKDSNLIFERSVQSPINVSSPPRTAPAGSSTNNNSAEVLLSSPRTDAPHQFLRRTSSISVPQHCCTEDLTAPVLDATAEVLSSNDEEDLNEVTIVSMKSARRNLGEKLCNCISRPNSGATTSSSANRSPNIATYSVPEFSPPTFRRRPSEILSDNFRSNVRRSTSVISFNNHSIIPPPLTLSRTQSGIDPTTNSPPQRKKSISFYTFNDILSMEKSTKAARPSTTDSKTEPTPLIDEQLDAEEADPELFDGSSLTDEQQQQKLSHIRTNSNYSIYSDDQADDQNCFEDEFRNEESNPMTSCSLSDLIRSNTGELIRKSSHLSPK